MFNAALVPKKSAARVHDNIHDDSAPRVHLGGVVEDRKHNLLAPHRFAVLPLAFDDAGAKSAYVGDRREIPSCSFKQPRNSRSIVDNVLVVDAGREAVIPTGGFHGIGNSAIWFGS